MDMTWHHVAISVRDMGKALHFYRDLLGFEVDWDKPQYSGEAFSKVVGIREAQAYVVMLKGHGTRIELFKYHLSDGEDSHIKQQCGFGITHFTFAVKGIHEIYESLNNVGVLFNCPPQNLRPGVYATYMKDPEGNTIELVEYE